ncbi:MAG: PAS domain S-box protein [Candidatus Thiodiazotropha sp.]
MSAQNRKIESALDNSNSAPHFFESMDRINRAIHSTSDLDQMMVNVLDTVLGIFECDRAFLVYPCDPEAEFWHVPMERTRPEFPGANASRAQIPMLQDVAASLKILLENQGPVTFGEGNEHPIAAESLDEFNIKSFMSMAIYPKVDKPWQFGIHQCSRNRTWSPSEVRLFQYIGRRLGDGLSLLLTFTELKKREETYSRIVTLASEGIWSIDASGKTTYANARMTEILGYSADEMEGRPVTDFMFEEDIPGFLQKLKAGFSNAPTPYERRYRRKNGDTVWVSVSATGIHDEDGNPIGGFGMISDITEKKQAEEALYRLNQELEAKVEARTRELQVSHEKLEEAYRDLKQAHASILHQEKMASIGQLASGIAHEINTPSQYVRNNISFIQESLDEVLSGMRACLETATKLKDGKTRSESLDNLETVLEELDYDYLKEELPRALNESAEGVDRITNIVVAMKDFAKPSRDMPEPVDISKLIEDTIEISRNSWKSVAELVVEPSPKPLVVAGLRDELGQVVLHLILNAADAIEAENQDSDTLGRIRIQTVGSETWAEIVVQDSGCGMTPEVQQRVFEPFFTTKDVGRGSGQGLAIAYHIITDKHDGELLVDSSPGEGSTFTIRLPVMVQPGNT